MIAVPTWIFCVCPAIHATGVTASDPYASAAHTEWKPSLSASFTSSMLIDIRAPEYPALSPNRIVISFGGPSYAETIDRSTGGVRPWQRYSPRQEPLDGVIRDAEVAGDDDAGDQG